MICCILAFSKASVSERLGIRAVFDLISVVLVCFKDHLGVELSEWVRCNISEGILMMIRMSFLLVLW